MIRVIGCRRGNAFVLQMKGHAGYAPKGHDIVCAGASALVHALAVTLELMDTARLQIDLADGRARVSCRTGSTVVHALYYQTLVGLILLQQEYPGHICVNTAGFFNGDLGKEQEEEEIA